jgi:hypothetical protein
MTKLVLLAVACAACAAEPGDRSATVSSIPRIASNALPPGALAGSALTTGVLDAGHAAAMAANGNAWLTLRYAVECALEASQSVSFSVGGVSYTLTGSLGLATGWTTAALGAQEASWVSACVLARVNATATSVTISARGDLTALAVTTGEIADYQIEEGAFWGNVFVDVGTVAGSACNGVDQLLDDSYGDLPVRQCAQDGGSGVTPCGFHFAGACASVCQSVNGAYTDCPAGGASTAQVVTTFLYGVPPY